MIIIIIIALFDQPAKHALKIWGIVTSVKTHKALTIKHVWFKIIK